MARVFPLFAAILGTIALPGCSTVSSRITEKSTVFVALPPNAQKELRQGRIEPGQTPDQVYIALGRPSSVEQQYNVTTWYYASILPASLETRPLSVIFEKDRVVAWEKRSPPDYWPMELDPGPTLGPNPYPQMYAPSAVQQALRYTP